MSRPRLIPPAGTGSGRLCSVRFLFFLLLASGAILGLDQVDQLVIANSWSYLVIKLLIAHLRILKSRQASQGLSRLLRLTWLSRLSSCFGYSLGAWVVQNRLLVKLGERVVFYHALKLGRNQLYNFRFLYILLAHRIIYLFGELEVDAVSFMGRKLIRVVGIAFGLLNILAAKLLALERFEV